jgi:hypothetical protein
MSLVQEDQRRNLWTAIFAEREAAEKSSTTPPAPAATPAPAAAPK